MSRRSSNVLQRIKLGALLAPLLTSAALCASSPAAADAASAPPCGNSTAAPAQLTLPQMSSSELCLINRVRVHYALHPLVFNTDLRDSAIGHSDSMVVHRYFAHEGPGGSVDTRISRAGYLWRAHAFTIGENIGAGGGRSGSPMAIFEDWMHSPPHRENILDPSYRDAGVGVARGYPFGGGRSAATYTVDFGARNS